MKTGGLCCSMFGSKSNSSAAFRQTKANKKDYDPGTIQSTSV